MEINLNPFFKDFGIFINIGETQIIAIKDNNDKDSFEKATTNTVYLRVKTADVVGLKEKDIVTIDGINFKVFKIYKLHDGRFSKLELNKIL